MKRIPALALAVSMLGAGTETIAPPQPPPALECNETAALTSTPTFDPPASGPLAYQWRDSTGLIVGSDPALDVTLPVGRHSFTLVVTAENGRAATKEVTLLVRDTTPPRVGVDANVVNMPVAGVNAAAPDAVRAAGFTVTDRCDPRPAVTVSPSGPYLPGDTRVVLTATDASGNSASAAVVIRVPRSAEPPRPESTAARPGEAPGIGPSSGPPSAPSAPRAPAEPSRPVVPPEPGTPETSPVPVGRPAPGANAPAAPGAAPIVVSPGTAATHITGWPWWWILVPGGLLLAGVLLFARRSHDRVPPPARATLRTRPRPDPGVQSLSLPPGVSQPRFELRTRPRFDSDAELVITNTSIVEERRMHV